jgi:uncharacterized protein (TIGR02147 family)
MTKNYEPQKSIFEHSDYRELLKDLFAAKKAKNKKFSYRYFARQAGFVSHSFLRFVMEGKSDLSLESIEKFIKGFKLNRDEAHFFKHLVLLNQAKTAAEQEIHAIEIFRSRGYRKIHPLKESQYLLYSNWYFIPVREVVGFTDFKEDMNWIAECVIPPISPEQAQLAINELLNLGLITRNARGELVQSNPSLSTPDEVISSSIAKWHREMMSRASESIDTIPREERDISAVTLSLPKESTREVKDLIQKFRKNLLELVSKETANNSVYQLNLQLFPLAHSVNKRKA